MQPTHIQALSDTALSGAIRQLELSGEWAVRLRQLLIERDRRRGKRRNPKS